MSSAVQQPSVPAPDIGIFSPFGRGGGSEHGGITPVVCNLSGALAEAGMRVELLTFSPADPRALFPSLDKRVQVWNLGKGSRLRHLFQLSRYLRERRPSVLLAAGQRPNLIAAVCKRLWRPHCRLFLSIHNSLSPGLQELGGLKRRMRIRGMRVTYPTADGLICVSTGVAEDLVRYLDLPPGKIHVIYNPVLSSEKLGSVPVAAQHPWLEPGQPPVILGAGRLTRQKDFSTLIRAFALVAADRDCRLMILGEGRERSALERLAAQLGLSGRIALPGFVSDVMGYMAQAALFVLSSAWEGFGMVVVEAMATGTPVVSTDCPSGPREILLDGELGPLVPVSDPGALARAILRALDAPADPERLRSRAADFTSDRVAERYLRLMFPSGQSRHGRS
jgi:glycosyltransferase involved in cell wall biosynthesis